ncbi:unnamed protein product [Schistocephalus solidus]|uniref:Rho-GAP domain-containing protein n=1 Tax=Schistocephalus solidus TaxID=70667 RepID=A0A183SJ19_SCHSO|nr:unnamed protein product [Schistocephalus solidus]
MAVQDAAFDALFTTRQDIANIYNDFKIHETTLSGTMKTWEKRCDQVLNARTEYSKAFNDLKKSKDKVYSLQQGNPDALRLAKAQTDEMEAASFVKKAEMLTESYKFSIEEDERMRCVHQYLEAMKRFFDESSSRLSTHIFKLAAVLDANEKTFFGTSLHDHLNDRGYSFVIETCVTYLMQKGGFDSEGIFRLAGHMSKIEILRQAFDHHKVDDELLDYCGVNVVGDVLKQYLRQLSEPLMTDDFVNNWLDPKNSLTPESAYSHLCSMPEANKKNLIMIIRLLGKITEHVDVTKMTPTNLATVLYMTFYRRSSDAGDLHSTPPEVANIVSYVSEHCAEILKDDNETGLIACPATPLISSSPFNATVHVLPVGKLPPEIPKRTYNPSSSTQVTQNADKRSSPVPCPQRPLPPVSLAANRNSVLQTPAAVPSQAETKNYEYKLKKQSDDTKPQSDDADDDSIVKSKHSTPVASDKDGATETSSDSDDTEKEHSEEEETSSSSEGEEKSKDEDSKIESAPAVQKSKHR